MGFGHLAFLGSLAHDSGLERRMSTPWIHTQRRGLRGSGPAYAG